MVIYKIVAIRHADSLSIRNALADKVKCSGGQGQTLWETNAPPEHFKSQCSAFQFS